jgi:3-phenylpropionate/trans-cinnamate dioxygenase ferredoxin subunit
MYNYKNLDPTECEFISIIDLTELPNGERLFVTIDRFSIVIFNIAGYIYALGDICSHDGNPLDDALLQGYEIICQRHGGSFDVHDGKAISMPAIVDIPAYPTRVVDGKIEIGLPIEVS